MVVLLGYRSSFPAGEDRMAIGCKHSSSVRMTILKSRIRYQFFFAGFVKRLKNRGRRKDPERAFGLLSCPGHFRGSPRGFGVGSETAGAEPFSRSRIVAVRPLTTAPSRSRSPAS